MRHEPMQNAEHFYFPVYYFTCNNQHKQECKPNILVRKLTYKIKEREEEGSIYIQLLIKVE